MKILLIIDVQNVFMNTNKLKKLPRKICVAIDSKKFDYIVGVQFHNHEDSSFVRFWNWKKSMPNSPESIFDKDIQNKCHHFFDKNTFSAFNNKLLTFFEKINFNKLEDKIYVCGLDTDVCVLLTCADLFINNYDIYVIKNLCGSDAGFIAHTSGINTLKHILGNNKIIKFKKNKK